MKLFMNGLCSFHKGKAKMSFSPVDLDKQCAGTESDQSGLKTREVTMNIQVNKCLIHLFVDITQVGPVQSSYTCLHVVF